MAPLGAQATNTTRSRTRGKPFSTKNPPRQQTNRSPGSENRPAGESKGKLRVPAKRPGTGTTEDAVRTKKSKKTTTGAPVPLEDVTQSASESNATSRYIDPYAQVPAQWEPPYSVQEAVARSNIVTSRQALDSKALDFSGIEEQHDDNHSLYASTIAQEQQPMQPSRHIPVTPNIDPMLRVHSASQYQIPTSSTSSKSNPVDHGVCSVMQLLYPF